MSLKTIGNIIVFVYIIFYWMYCFKTIVCSLFVRKVLFKKKNLSNFCEMMCEIVYINAVWV